MCHQLGGFNGACCCRRMLWVWLGTNDHIHACRNGKATLCPQSQHPSPKILCQMQADRGGCSWNHQSGVTNTHCWLRSNLHTKNLTQKAWSPCWSPKKVIFVGSGWVVWPKVTKVTLFRMKRSLTTTSLYCCVSKQDEWLVKKQCIHLILVASQLYWQQQHKAALHSLPRSGGWTYWIWNSATCITWELVCCWQVTCNDSNLVQQFESHRFHFTHKLHRGCFPCEHLSVKTIHLWC